MSPLFHPVTGLVLLASAVLARPSFNHTQAKSSLSPRDGSGTPWDWLPERPEDVPVSSFHYSRFEYFDQIGFVPGSPGVEAAPVFLFARTEPIYDPCVPESAIIIGSDPPKPNPGTSHRRGPAGVNPGHDCNDPGSYHGAYTMALPFPVYVGATLCDDDWRVNYALYYVHDGVMSEGHRHDWESVTVVFKRDEQNGDWYHRDSVIYSQHSWYDRINWTDLISVEAPEGNPYDIRDETTGTMKAHPKDYVGFFSHANFPNKDDSRKTMMAPFTRWIALDEYRSDDWWYLPRARDMHLANEIDIFWNYGKAWSSPPRNKFEMCDWGNKPIPMEDW